jgi:tetratricopeptide (TPR) repeat protein
MKKLLVAIGCLGMLTACTDSKNSEAFISATQGRYLFNADEVMEVSFEDSELKVQWRNQKLTPLKVNDSTFYLQAMNEKLIFQPKLAQIKLATKKEHHGKNYTFTKLGEGQRTPSEYLNAGQFTEALQGFLAIQQQDSLSPLIRERTLNKLGYRHLRNNNIETAIQVFTINTKLHPKSSNTYDSLADAYLEQKDTIKAIENYQLALNINPERRSSKRQLEKLLKKE